MRNENEKLLSIIMPIYNVGKFLKRAIDSIINLDCNDKIEILLIDDGSSDESVEICDLYDLKYSNIKVFHKSNGGLSDARNFGLLRCTGEYVFFFDSDDMVDTTEFLKFLKILESIKEEIVLWNAITIDEDDKILENSYNYYSHIGLVENVKYNGISSIIEQLKSRNDYPTTVWLGVYKREFLLKKALWFEVGILHEDELWTPKALLNAESVRYINSTVYKYRIRNNSIMTDKKSDKSTHLKDLIFIYTTLYSYYEWRVLDKTKRSLIMANNSKRILYSITQYNANKNIIRTIPKFDILRYSKGYNDVIRAIILFININLYCKLYCLIKNIK